MIAARSNRSAGFSLPEVLMAIFILGIGVISIAALFPAGIAQQRQAVDDTMGPLVAQNAMALIRSRVDPGDFGTFEEFGKDLVTLPADAPGDVRQRGDWPWLRPAFIFPNGNYPLGAIDIFNGTNTGTSEFDTGRSSIDSGLPYSTNRYGSGAAQRPRITISQEERYYPQTWIDPSTSLADQRPPKPQYLWDCMFRRYQGRIYVAVFVYRVTVAGAAVAFTQVPNGSEPPLPHLIDVTGGNDALAWDAWGLDNVLGTADDAIVRGSSPCSSYDAANLNLSWQEQGQWILDQNNNVHRVLSTYCDDDVRQVELVRPVPAVPDIGANFVGNPGSGIAGVTNIVTDIWYIPRSLFAANGVEYRLTPVYLTVRGL